MPRASELGDFLRTRRGALRPEDVGLTPYGERRRVPGLRREELCLLAGVSVTHYTRLEQGRGTRVSREVLTAIARALRLDDDETAHLMDLAAPAGRPAPPRPEHAGGSARQLITAMAQVPALILDRRNDVLAWNERGHALLGRHLDFGDTDLPAHRPNLTRMLFLEEHMRDLYGERWPEEATLAVASLRLAAGRHPDDRRLAELVGQLAVQSEEFAERWARHPVRTCTSGTKRMDHPVVGRMELAFETLQIPGGPGQRLIAYSAAPGSPSERALHDLLREDPPGAAVRLPAARPAGAAGR
ncbi:helix-turn-helix transcriptional regulator [Nocardiopsis sp. CC223A]|uniref:helix-turn-helix transcriptional regulator n=1 Tax=Nocardiopsis sp. CC223A TaxID=3044051 RepID=UPI00278BDCCB|nr:helix-turn-helix transcriptional regulator [Nocardiopsis sp. CC223A]